VRLLLLALTLALGFTIVSAGVPAVAAPPPPSVSPPTCVVGGDTTISYKHVHGVVVQVQWYNSSGGLVATDNAPLRGGHYSAPTPVTVDSGGRAEFFVQFSSGATDRRTAFCS